MTVVSKALTVGDKALVVVATLCAIVTLCLWLQAILAWGSARPFGSALMWTAITLVLYIPGFVNRGG